MGDAAVAASGERAVVRTTIAGPATTILARAGASIVFSELSANRAGLEEADLALARDQVDYRAQLGGEETP
jgi:hypothetical protein